MLNQNKLDKMWEKIEKYFFNAIWIKLWMRNEDINHDPAKQLSTDPSKWIYPLAFSGNDLSTCLYALLIQTPHVLPEFMWHLSFGHKVLLPLPEKLTLLSNVTPETCITALKSYFSCLFITGLKLVAAERFPQWPCWDSLILILSFLDGNILILMPLPTFSSLMKLFFRMTLL